MPVPEALAAAIEALRTTTGENFQVTERPVDGTEMHVVYLRNHTLPTHYSSRNGLFGFRVPARFPDACPEDCFFLVPWDIKLAEQDPVRKSTDPNRAGKAENLLKGTELDDVPVLMFSWHLWNTVPWDRNKHTLMDHYRHCLRRFDQSEHD